MPNLLFGHNVRRVICPLIGSACQDAALDPATLADWLGGAAFLLRAVRERFGPGQCRPRLASSARVSETIDPGAVCDDSRGTPSRSLVVSPESTGNPRARPLCDAGMTHQGM